MTCARQPGKPCCWHAYAWGGGSIAFGQDGTVTTASLSYEACCHCNEKRTNNFTLTATLPEHGPYDPNPRSLWTSAQSAG